MIIRKQFKFEGSHVVRGCTSRKCSQNIHGHSYKVDVLIEGHKLDNGHMILDFGLLKREVKDFIESFDHAHAVWRDGDETEINFITNNVERWILTPLSPSAEGFAIMFFSFVKKLLEQTEFSNGEGDIRLYSVRVHETETGYAEAFQEDIPVGLHFPDFSYAIKQGWNDSDMLYKLLTDRTFKNPKEV